MFISNYEISQDITMRQALPFTLLFYQYFFAKLSSLLFILFCIFLLETKLTLPLLPLILLCGLLCETDLRIKRRFSVIYL